MMNEIENVLDVNLENKNFRFFALDFREAPSLFSAGILEKQSNFILKCLQYVR